MPNKYIDNHLNNISLENDNISNSILNDIVYVSDEINTESLKKAYSTGIFPWPEDDNMPVLWFCPNPRGILQTKNFHLSRSLKKTIRRNNFTFTTDMHFNTVINHCSILKRQGEPGTWITENTIQAYRQFHKDGYAHSLEIFCNDKLAGGLYGVFINNVFSGESMFHLQKDTSKIALAVLIKLLEKSGIKWIDTQMLTPVIESLGGELVSRKHYLNMLNQSHRYKTIKWPSIQKPLLVSTILNI